MADIVINDETFPGVASVTLNTATDTATFLSTNYVLVGTPLVANEASEMTETDKIYIYTGDEQGYTAGNWYFYNGTSWESGGVYSSSGGGISDNARNLLKYVLERVAYTETGMQVYVDALYEALKLMDSPVAETYTILNTLVNVTNSNGATSIASGSAYSATLSVESGYTWGTVTITMGETDITSTAYNSSTHEISIASVTGDLVIVASATAPVTTYTITNALSHVSNSNTSASIQANSSYSGTLTADTNYTIDSVTVTMGNVDITSTAYTSGTGAISIASVTGDIVITARAINTITGYTQVGSPTISSNILTCSDGNFIKTTEVFSPSSNTWAIRAKYQKTGSQGFYADIFGSVDNNNASYRSVLFEMNTSGGDRGCAFLSSDGANWDISGSVQGIVLPNPANTWVWAEISFDGSHYYLKTSTDGETWTTRQTITSTSVIVSGYPVAFGLKRNGVFTGQIDLTECKIWINNALWWKAV